MTSQRNLSKRRLPGWMETVNVETKKVANLTYHKCVATGTALSVEKIGAKKEKLHWESNTENLDVVNKKATPESVEEIPTPQGTSVGVSKSPSKVNAANINEIPTLQGTSIGVSKTPSKVNAANINEIPTLQGTSVGVSKTPSKVNAANINEIPTLQGTLAEASNITTSKVNAANINEIPTLQGTLAKASNITTSKVNAANIIAQSMPVLLFKGRTVYSYHHDDCACLCEDILSTLIDSKITCVGFDTEWPVSFQKSSSSKTALIQMCLSDTVCYLFQVSAMLKLPRPLINLISDTRITLVGLNIESDLWKLERDFDFRVKPIIDRGSVIDVGKLANQKLKSCERWTLDGLCRNVLRKRLNKGDELRFGDWSEVPLSEEMKLYGASDAYAGLLLYQHLSGGSS